MSTPTRDLVLGNRILAHHAILDAYGHCSIRNPENPDQFIMSRARAPELVTEDDLQTFDLLGNLIGSDRRASYIERFIHSGIYEARPDVQAICHSHTPSVIPYSVIDMPLKVVFHTGAGIGTNVPVWDFQTDFGLTNMLVSNVEQGRSLARTLGQGRMALMRGHGCVFAGRSIQDVVSTGVYMDMNARMATTAHLLSGGKVHYLSDDEVLMRLSAPAASADGAPARPRVGREWEAWCAQIGEPLDETEVS